MNFWKIAGMALTVIGAAVGLVADFANGRNQIIEAREEAREAAIDEVHRMFADNNQNEEEV